METYNLTTTVKGDTFNGVEFTFIKNEAAINLTGATIKATFRAGSQTGKASKVLTNTSGITITSAAEGKFKINPFIANMEAGVYYYDIELTIGTVVKTYVGGTFTITQDVT